MLRLQKDKLFYSILFILPTFIIFTYFIIVPIGFTIYYSFTRWNGMSQPIWIGLSNYMKMFTSTDYRTVLTNTFILIVVALLVQIPISLTLAFLIYKTKRGARFFKASYFLPVVIAPTAIALMFSLFFNSDVGPLNAALGSMGLKALQQQWLSSPATVLFAVILPGIWQHIGFYVVIFLAALYGLPEEVFESAAIDGANSFHVFTRIVVPLLRNIIGVATIFAVTGSLKSFEYPYIMTFGGPGVRSSFLGLFVYKTAFTDYNFGYASTVAVSILVIAIIFAFILKKVSFDHSLD